MGLFYLFEVLSLSYRCYSLTSDIFPVSKMLFCVYYNFIQDNPTVGLFVTPSLNFGYKLYILWAGHLSRYSD